MATSEVSAADQRRHIVGASLTSAVGSLPTHLMPLTFVAIVAGGTVSAESAGWIATALLLGQLLTSVGLPLIGIAVVGRAMSALVSLGLLAGMALSGAAVPGAHLAGWFLAGACCGILQFLGAVAAAHYRTPVLAFALRLGVVLLLAGACIAFAQGTGAVSAYGDYIAWMIAAFAIVLAIGNLLYVPMTGRSAQPDAPEDTRLTAAMIAGLAAAFVLFVGQTGLLTYVVLSAVDRGIGPASAVWTFAGVKVAAGLWMVFSTQARGNDAGILGFLGLGVVVAAAGFAMYSAPGAVELFAVLTGFEIAFNMLSARLQGAIATTGPQATGRWIAGTLLLGAACGPPLNGWAIGAGLGQGFVAFAMVTALVPLCWRVLCRHAVAGNG